MVIMAIAQKLTALWPFALNWANDVAKKKRNQGFLL